MAKSKAFKHEIYLNEEEICDLLEAQCDFWAPIYERSKLFREYQIGSCRPDFIQFIIDHIAEPSIRIYEVKITANVSSVRQLVHYKRSIDTYLQYKSKLNPVLTELPTVSLTLMARNFDMEIIDLCNELNIALWKVNVLSKEKIDIEHFDTEFLKPVHDSPSFVKDLRSFFGGTNG